MVSSQTLSPKTQKTVIIDTIKNATLYTDVHPGLRKGFDFLQNFDAGVTYLAKDNLQFDLSFGTGINHRMNYISLGCCWKIGKL